MFASVIRNKRLISAKTRTRVVCTSSRLAKWPPSIVFKSARRVWFHQAREREARRRGAKNERLTGWKGASGARDRGGSNTSGSICVTKPDEHWSVRAAISPCHV